MPTFNTADVIKVFYFTNITKHRRMFIFTGLCTNLNKKTRAFTVKNFCGTEFVTFSFQLGAPNIVAIDVLRSYNFKFRQSKLVATKKLHLLSRTDAPSPKRPAVRKDALSFFYIPKTIYPKEKKRLRHKFRL